MHLLDISLILEKMAYLVKFKPLDISFTFVDLLRNGLILYFITAQW